MMKTFRDYLQEAEAEPQVIDGPNGTKTTINPDGTRTVSDDSGTKTYNAQGQLVKSATPNIGGVQQTTDVGSGDVTTDYSAGPMQTSKTVTPGGYTKQSSMDYDLGVAQVGQKTQGPDIASGQLAGVTTTNVKNIAGQQASRVQGVGFGGASGKRVGQNWVGAGDDELDKVAGFKDAEWTQKEDLEQLRTLSGIKNK